MDDLLTFTAILESKGMATKHVYLDVHLKSAFPLLYHTISHYTESPHFTTIPARPLLHSAPGFPNPGRALSLVELCKVWDVRPSTPPSTIQVSIIS